FVRFFGCNLSCGFCDTPLATFKEYTVAALREEIAEFSGYQALSLTGGEPLLQADFLKGFLEELRGMNAKIYLETNGTLPVELGKILDLVDVIAVDFKLPSFGGQDCWQEHEEFLKRAKGKDVFVKIPVAKSATSAEIKKAADILSRIGANIPVVLQPNWFELDSALLEKIESFKKDLNLYGLTDVRILPQMHKLVGIK
ncbi:MAG: 7-carboxy-7-deazaguanine synthase QueE, partial [Candidatus Omnitrophota bacterium]